MTDRESVHHLNVIQFLEDDEDLDLADSTVLIILNTPIHDYTYLLALSGNAIETICADGGANRVYDTANEISDETETDLREILAPDIIHGDLDSLRDDVREFYKSMDVEISHDPDQYSTDLAKCIKMAVEREPDVENILVFGSLAGRVDQGIGLLHELHREQKSRHPGVRFWLFSECSISVILTPGTTTIETPLKSGILEPNVGILPLYGPAIISTQGLEWDVTDWSTQMGGQVSTSNHIKADQISITTDVEVLFTVERKLLFPF